MNDAIQRGALFYHTKAEHTYVVLGVGVIEADLTPAVIYTRWRPQPEDNKDVWIRPRAEFQDGRFAHCGWDFDYARLK